MQLKPAAGRVICKIDCEQKNFFTLSNGTTIRLERDYNNLDRSYTQQTLGICVSAENIPTDALILFHFNCIHDVNRLFNTTQLSGDEIANGIKLYSLREEEVFLWKMPNEQKWNSTGVFETALRVYKPYTGLLTNIEPTVIKDVLYVTSGDLKGKVVKCLKASDYTIKFRNEKGVDEVILRFRPNGDEKNQRDAEAIAILWNDTEKVRNGEYLIGTEIKSAYSLPPDISLSLNVPIANNESKTMALNA